VDGRERRRGDRAADPLRRNSAAHRAAAHAGFSDSAGSGRWRWGRKGRCLHSSPRLAP
jgi:hypothetical protein